MKWKMKVKMSLNLILIFKEEKKILNECDGLIKGTHVYKVPQYTANSLVSKQKIIDKNL